MESWILVIILLGLSSWLSYLYFNRKSLSKEETELLAQLKLKLEEPQYIPIEGPANVIERHIPAPIDVPRLETAIKEIPAQVVRSIVGSTNYHKGSLGELTAYLELSSTYDRIICLGNIVDYIGIRFPTDKDPGTVDFIDVKTGRSARANKDQNKLKSIIQNGHVQFAIVKVSSSTHGTVTGNNQLDIDSEDSISLTADDSTYNPSKVS